MKPNLASLVIGVGLCLPLTPALSGPAGLPNPDSATSTARVDPAPGIPGPGSSLTILPVRVAGAPTSRVAEVVGLLLERRGLANLELGPSAFAPAAQTSLNECAAQLREFLRQHPVTSDYVLYAEFNGTPQTGLTELRALVVTAGGEEVWREEKSAGGSLPAAWAAREPMTMAALLVRQLEPRFGLGADTAAAAKPGKFTRLMEERSGLPAAEERSAMPARQQRLAADIGQATFAIFPPRIHGSVDTECAVHLAQQFAEDRIGRACSVAAPLLLPGSAPDPNELRALWDLARKVREHVRAHPPGADYVLYADYGYNESQWERGFVHFVVCDARGDWVIVDLQNSHQPDYRTVRPTTKADCDHIVLVRLKGYLQRAARGTADATTGQ